MQTTGLAHLFELAPQPGHALPDHAAVGLNLGFSWAAQEAEAAALAFQVGPAAHEPALLVIEMGKLNLQAPFGGCCAFAEDFQDQTGAVDHLAFQTVFQIALLDRSERTIDDDELAFVLFA